MDATSASDGVAKRPGRVLVVEDHADAAESLRQALERMGTKSTWDGTEGIALANKTKSEIVLCDIGLPGRDGLRAARHLRDFMPNAVVLAVTGYGQSEDQKRAAEAGSQGPLTKPPKLEELERLIAQF